MINLLAIGAAIIIGIGLWFVTRLSQNLFVGLASMIFFLPFERLPSLTAAGVTFKMNHVIGGLALIFWLLELAFRHRSIRRNGFAALLAIFVGVLVLSAAAGGFERRELAVLLATTFSLCLGLLIPQLLVRRDQVRPVLMILGITSFISIIFGFYQFAGDMIGLPISLTGLDIGYTKDLFGFPRIQAFAQEPLYYGNLLLIPIGLSLSLLLVDQQWFPKKWLILVSALSLVSLGLTASRGALVGLIALLICLVILLGKRLIIRGRLVQLAVGFVLGIALLIGGLSFTGDIAQEQFVSHVTVQDFGQGDSTAGRLRAWFQAIDLWQDAPYLGVGPGQFGPAILNYPSEPPASGWPIVNNEYFELLAETGLIGLAIFGLFVFVLFVRSYRAYQMGRSDPELRGTLIGLIIAVVGILVQYNFFSTLYINPIWITFGLLIAVQTLILERTHA